MTFSEKIKKTRRLLGDITQAKLAKLIGVNQASISGWETGISNCREPNLIALEKLCAKKGIKINWRK